MVIQAYREHWAADFSKIKEVIKQALGGIDVEIEHIGSTSIRDLAAKPIIDIDISYTPNVKFEQIRQGLERLAYVHRGDQGIVNRDVFKRQEGKKKHEILDTIKHHLYVCPSHSEELQRHLAFRNYLKEHPTERKEYEKLKYEIAELADQDRKAYAQIKEIKAKAFIESILVKAQRLK